MWDSESLQQWENFFGIIVLQFSGHPPAGMEFDFIMIAPLLSFLCGLFFVFRCGVSFCGGFQWPPIDGRSTAGCDFNALTEEVALIS